MTGPLYYGRDGRPVPRDVGLELFEDAEARRVARTRIDAETDVSTVHLVFDHGWGSGPPLIFETMVFGGPHDQDQWRYATEAEAVAGHERVVAALRDGRDPDADERRGGTA